MKILCVGDTHGSYIPLNIAKEKEPEVDKIVFLGDYVDSYENSWPTEQKVLEQIIEFKLQHDDKVVLLLGNHDIEYLKISHILCNTSGHQNKYHMFIKTFLEKYLDLFHIVYKEEDWLFSHAGVSTQWLQNPLGLNYRYVEDISQIPKNWDVKDINEAFVAKQYKYFEHNSEDPYGNDPGEGCLWIRPKALLTSSYPCNQVVGHTELKSPVAIDNNFWKLPNRVVQLQHKIVFIDSPMRNTYAIIDTDENTVQVSDWYLK